MLTATLTGFEDLEATAQALFTTSGGPTSIQLPLGLDRDGFERFCVQYPDLRTELEPSGTVTIMSPLVATSGEFEAEAFGQLRDWYKRTRLGRIYNSSVGFTLPSGAVKAPDACWISPERVAEVPLEEWDRFARVVPDFVIEVRSKSDSLKQVKIKMVDSWIGAGIRLGWLIDPLEKRVYIYHEGRAVEAVSDFSLRLSAESVVPGFALDLSEFS